MTKIENLKNVLAGKKVEQIPYSFWHHFPEIDLIPEELAKKTIEFYRDYDLDFIKLMSNGMYSVEGYGALANYAKIPKGGKAEIVQSPISSYEELNQLAELTVDSPVFARELKSLELVFAEVGKEVPIIFTIFSPLTTLKKLLGSQFETYILAADSQPIFHALETITKATQKLTDEAISRGAAGIFFATQLGSFDHFTTEQYEIFGKPYDLRVLASAERGWFNVVHVHGKNIFFDLFKDYPTQVFNWHSTETLPTISEAIHLSGKTIAAGLSEDTIQKGNLNAIRNQIYEAIQASQGKKIILTTGCGISLPVKKEYLNAVRKSKALVEAALKDFSAQTA